MKLIYCKGRYTKQGKEECVDKFKHYGDWGDKELNEHQEKEKKLDNIKTWWTGYTTDNKFDKMKEKIKDIKSDF
jgi:hypothetical protein